MPRFDSRSNGGHPAATDLGLDDLIPVEPPGESSEETAALAELFLGVAPTDPAEPFVPRHAASKYAPPRQNAPAIEGLILGHLPVLASAWVQQYARHIASELRGPVALLRLRPNEASLELISASGVIHQTTQCATLADALAVAAREATTLLVRTDETTEPRLAELAGLDTLTLLSGADEAATVASYRTIKNLTAGMDVDGHVPQVNLVIMGATPPQASDAAGRIERAASAFLDRHVRVTACISKIGGGKSTPLYRGTFSESTHQVLASLRHCFVPSGPRTYATVAPRPTPQPHRVPASEPPIPLASESLSHPEPIVSRLGHLSSTPAPASLPTRLCDHVQGLSPAGIACPYTPAVEFALGPDGFLHLLTHLDYAKALPDLLTAAAWTRTHESLLKQILAKGPRANQWTAEPVLHAFTADAASVHRLADAPLRLHLLAQVHAGGHAAWFSTPLN